MADDSPAGEKSARQPAIGKEIPPHVFAQNTRLYSWPLAVFPRNALPRFRTPYFLGNKIPLRRDTETDFLLGAGHDTNVLAAVSFGPGPFPPKALPLARGSFPLERPLTDIHIPSN
jgi:hypothetical protein